MAYTQGYKGRIKWKGAVLRFIGDPTWAGIERNEIDTTALADGLAPFRSWIPGRYGYVNVSGQIGYDTSNAGVTGVIASFNAGATGCLAMYDAVSGGNCLLTGSAGVKKSQFMLSQDGLQLLDIIIQYSGAITGAICAHAT